MSFQSNNNAVLFNNCQTLQNLTVLLKVTETLSTVEGAGFSLQLNAYPPPGQLSQEQTLIIFQYIVYVKSNNLWYEIQYWASGTSWPPGYKPVPHTTPQLPAWPSDDNLTQFASAPGNQILAGSELQISLATDSNGNVTSAVFSYTDPNANVSSKTFTVPRGAAYPITAFEVNLVGPGGGSNCTFVTGLTSSRGIFYYSVSPGTLSVQSGGPGAACGEWNGGTAETSNAVYTDVNPASGSTVTQTLGQPVDCAISDMVRKEGGTGASAQIGQLQALRDSQFSGERSGQWLIEFLGRYSADIAGLLDEHPELRSQGYALLAKAESAATANSSFSPELINEAEAWLKGVSSVARGSLKESAPPLQKILDSLRGHTLEQGLQAASQIIHPRFPTSARKKP